MHHHIRRISVLLAICLLASVSHATAKENVIKLKFAAYHGLASAECRFMQDFIRQVEAKSDGLVSIKFFPGGSFLKPKEMYDGVANGIADIGAGNIGYNSGKFPQLQLALGPIGVTSPYSFTHALNDFFEKFQPKEFKDTHILWLWGNGPSVLMSTDPIDNLQSLSRQRIRANSETGETLKALGGSPQSIGMGELYEAISKRVVNGVMSDPSVLVSFKIGDVVHYVTDLSSIGSGYIFYVAMNKDKWNALPEKVKAVFNDVAASMVEASAVAVNQEDIDGLAYARSKGAKILRLSEEQAGKWSELTRPLVDDYLESLEGRGFSLSEQTAALDYLKSRLAYWAGDQRTKKIPFPLETAP